MGAKGGFLVGLIVLGLVIFSTGFYTLMEDEALIVVEYFGASIEITESDGPPSLTTPFGNIYWRLPWPLGISHKVNLKPHEFELKSPMAFPYGSNYYLILTKEGFKLVYTYELTDANVMILNLKGKFKITDLKTWAEIDAYGKGDEVIINSLSSALAEYAYNRIGEIYNEETEKNPNLESGIILQIVAEEIISNPKKLSEGFKEFVSELEKATGIDISQDTETEMSEEPILKYL